MFLKIMFKEFRHNFRNWKANIMMIIFPIVLMTILGAAFTNSFASNLQLGDVRVLYSAQENTPLSNAFHTFAGDIEKEMAISFEETNNIQDGINSIKDIRYSCYVLITEDPQEIKIYKNTRYDFEANLFESLVKTFASRYSSIAQIAHTNPALLPRVMTEPQGDFVETQSLDRKRQASSLDYYAVTMLTLILMYASLTGLWSIKNEKNYKTQNRILAGPVSKFDLLTGKVLGGILITLIQTGVVILFSKYILNAYWGPDIFTIMLVIVSQAIMAISIGTGIAYLIRSDSAATGVLNVAIPIFVFLGGGYVPLSMLGTTLGKISGLSPVRWTNSAIFRVIYETDYSQVAPAILGNLFVAALFIIVSVLLSRKEAV